MTAHTQSANKGGSGEPASSFWKTTPTPTHPGIKDGKRTVIPTSRDLEMRQPISYHQ